MRSIILLSLLALPAFAAEVPEPASSKKGEVVSEPVLILHKGDPMPPPGRLYSYDSKETEADFYRRFPELKPPVVEEPKQVSVNPLRSKTCVVG